MRRFGSAVRRTCKLTVSVLIWRVYRGGALGRPQFTHPFDGFLVSHFCGICLRDGGFNQILEIMYGNSYYAANA